MKRYFRNTAFQLREVPKKKPSSDYFLGTPIEDLEGEELKQYKNYCNDIAGKIIKGERIPNFIPMHVIMNGRP